MKPIKQRCNNRYYYPTTKPNYIWTRLRLKTAVRKIIAENRVKKTSEQFQKLDISQRNSGWTEDDIRKEILARYLYRDELHCVLKSDKTEVSRIRGISPKPRKRLKSRKIKQQKVDPVQSATTVSESVSCTVLNEMDGTTWSADGKFIKAVVGGANDGLYLWTLAENMGDSQAFVFGYREDSSWKYITPVGPRQTLRFMPNDISPLDIKPIQDDPRTFYGRTDSRRGSEGIMLVSAKFENMAVDVGSGSKLVLTDINNMNNVPTWTIRET